VNEDAWAQEIQRLEALVAGAAGAMAFPLLAEAHRRAGRPESAERVAREGLARAPQVVAGRVALALALLDQKRVAEASAELERVLGSEAEHTIAVDAAIHDAPEGMERGESLAEFATFDFDLVEPDAPVALEPPTAGSFGPPPPPAAHQALFGSDELADDEVDGAFDSAEAQRDQMLGADDVARVALASVPAEAEDEDAGISEDSTSPDSPFATATVAGLLDRQGHGAEAERIRASLAAPPDANAHADEAEMTNDASETPTPRTPAARGRQATLERWLENLRGDKR